MKYVGLVIDDYCWGKDSTFELIKMSGAANKKAKNDYDKKHREELALLASHLQQYVPNQFSLARQQQSLCSSRAGLFGGVAWLI